MGFQEDRRGIGELVESRASGAEEFEELREKVGVCGGVYLSGGGLGVGEQFGGLVEGLSLIEKNAEPASSRKNKGRNWRPLRETSDCQ